MKRKILSVLLALATVLSISACGQGESTGTGSTDANQTDSNASGGATGEGDFDYASAKNDPNTLIWMSHYDLNPTGNTERSAELALFEDTYGGKIVYNQTTWDGRFDDLATAIVADQSPDIFPYEWIAFPSGIMKGQYQPIDDIVDWTDPKWAGMLDEADAYLYKGQHYIAPYEIIESLLLIYDRTLIQEEGLPDPYELYENGEWTWDAFKSMMQTFCQGGDDRIGCMNAFGRSMVMSTGQTFVTYDGEKFINNVNNADIGRVQEFLSSLAKEGLTGNGEYLAVSQAMVKGNVLFYGSGNWDIDMAIKAGNAIDHEVFVVTMPRDPQSDELYVAENLQAHMWVAGSTKKDLVKTWFDCLRTVKTDEEYLAKAKESQLENTLWTSEIYDAVMDIRSDKFKKVFDYGYGVSDSMSTIIEELYNCCCFDNEANTGWANISQSYAGTMDGYLEEINARFGE